MSGDWPKGGMTVEEVVNGERSDLEERLQNIFGRIKQLENLSASRARQAQHEQRIAALELETANLRLNCPGYHPPAPPPAEPPAREERCALCTVLKAEHLLVLNHQFTPPPAATKPCGVLVGRPCDHDPPPAASEAGGVASGVKPYYSDMRNPDPSPSAKPKEARPLQIPPSDWRELIAQARADAAEVKRLREQMENERTEAQRHYNEWEDECERLRAQVERVEKLVERDGHIPGYGGACNEFVAAIRSAMRDEEEKS
jgi:DNA repair exonuclease SbcCD ATPase subunit